MLAALTVFSIATSVALVTGLEMSSRSARAQVRGTADAMIGASQIEITAGTTGVPEGLLDRVKRAPGVLAASPILIAKFQLPGRNFPINVLGMDLLEDRQVRQNSITRDGIQIRDPLRLFAVDGAGIITRSLLDRLDLSGKWDRREPTVLHVRSSGIDSTLVVQAILEPGGVASAYGGQLAVMDVYMLQAHVGRQGWFDRIDVVPTPGTTVPDLISSLERLVGGVATVRRSSRRSKYVEGVLDTLDLAVLMFVGVGGAVCCLLTYSAMSLAVERQRRQLAIFRAVGMEAECVRHGVYLESATIAAAGTLLGIAGGVYVSGPMLELFSTFTESFRSAELHELSFRSSTVLAAASVGLISAAAGSWGPARRASRRFTLDELEHDALGPGRPRTKWAVAALVLSVIVFLAGGFGRIVGLGAVSRFCLLFVGGLLIIQGLVPTFPGVLTAASKQVARLTRRGPGFLAGRSFHAKPWRFAVAITAVSGVVAALASMLLLVESLASTLADWTASRYPDAVLITAGSLDPQGREVITPDAMRLIRDTPGVEAVDEQYWVLPTILFRGTEVSLSAFSMNVIAEFGHLATVDRPSKEVARALAEGAIAVSAGFSKYFGVDSGDAIEINTPRGVRTFPVAGIVKEYRDAAGSIVLDIDTYDRYWSRSGAWAAAVWTSGNREQVIDAIRERTRGVQDIFVEYGDELLEVNRNWVYQFTGLLFVIAGLIAALGGLATTILLVGTVVERRSELALIRAAGAEPFHLITLILLDALIVALVSTTFGISLGYALAVPMVDILRDSYGWIIDQAWTSTSLLALVLGTGLAATLGAMLPAAIAYSTRPTDVFSPE